ncbi:MAG TPA: Panacea domain-containing protein [Streptosporangiaceae bacterium]|nr:Panacea domain-containing protein [Streptosporangiaceae bacterium]
MPPSFSQPPDPLVSSVLALLKAAKEQGCDVNRTKLAKLLYFADLKAVEEGGTAFSGATWRWRNYGPYDNALMRAESTIVSADLAERHDDRDETGGSCTLRLAIDGLADPLPPEHMEIIRTVVREYGRKGATALKNLSYKTPPMVEAQAAGDREVILNLSRARRARQARELIARHRRQRASQPQRLRDPAAAADLLKDHEALAELRRRANARALGEE